MSAAARPTLSSAAHAVILFAAILLAAIVLVMFAVDRIVDTNPVVIAGLVLNLVLAAVGLAWSAARDAISLRVIFWYYSLLFLTIAPLAQYLTDRWIYPVQEQLIIQANMVILVSFACFGLTSALGRRARDITADTRVSAFHRALSERRLLACAIASLALVITLIWTLGFSLSESLVLKLFDGEFTPVSMLAEFVLRPLVFFVFLIAVLRWRWGRRTYNATAIVTLTAVAALLMLGPLSGARFFIFAMYLGLLLILLPPAPRTRYLYVMLLFAGIVASHVFSVLRAVAAEQQIGLTRFTSSYFYEGHFDGFENLCHAISYVAREGIAWGEQFLGAVLFWVPREWWPTKPVGSATYITSTYLVDFYRVGSVNVAAPLVQEAYLNFHVPGVIIVFSVLGYWTGRADVLFGRALARLVNTRQRRLPVVDGSLGYNVLYPVLVGLLLFVLRGDLLSSFAFTMGIVAAFILVSRLARVRKRDGAVQPEWALARGATTSAQ